MKTISAILLMCFTGFAFADGHLEAEEGEHPNPNYVEIGGDGPQGPQGPQGDDGEHSNPNYIEENGIGPVDPPDDGSLPEGGGPNKGGLPPAGGDVEEGEEQPE